MPDPEAREASVPVNEATDAGPISRRSVVLGGIATLGTAVIAAGAFGRAATAVYAQDPLSRQVVAVDPELCMGCLACEVNCSNWHASVGRSAVQRIRVMRTPQVKIRASLAQFVGDARGGFTPQTCRQCPTPWCLPNCPTNALHIDPETGNRYINERVCIDCGKCEVDCPVPFEGTQVRYAAPISSKRVVHDASKNVYNKCDLCVGRDGGPICVERCPVNVAIRAGSIKSDHLALELKRSTPEQWEVLT